MVNEPLHVSDESFKQTVLQASLPVVVDFWAPWCGPCKMIAPVLEKIASEQAGKLLVTKVNTDENPQWAMHFGVQSIPTLLFMVNGQVVHQQVGALPEKYMKELVSKFLEAVNEAAPI
ncbi:MAG: thioredoxin [Anaerolineae bacterium]|nr:thioredoxin [Anaerolineae bacterium]